MRDTASMRRRITVAMSAMTGSNRYIITWENMVSLWWGFFFTLILNNMKAYSYWCCWIIYVDVSLCEITKSRSVKCTLTCITAAVISIPVILYCISVNTGRPSRKLTLLLPRSADVSDPGLFSHKHSLYGSATETRRKVHSNIFPPLISIHYNHYRSPSPPGLQIIEKRQRLAER